MKIIPPPSEAEFKRVFREKILLPRFNTLYRIISENQKYSNVNVGHDITSRNYYKDYYKVYLKLLEL